ncbi:nuclear transport factor 2 family protein [Cryptosporangium japonicum]|uniref:nuclear transport factor 2 family protein n=1 Tax=Cryptosporangium japonicum TaxID=80872 RepID=UPI003CD0BFEB
MSASSATPALRRRCGSRRAAPSATTSPSCASRPERTSHAHRHDPRTARPLRRHRRAVRVRALVDERAFPDADHAETTSYLHAWHGVAGADVDPVVLARYVDRLERTPTGWRIAHRRMFAHGLIGFPEGVIRPLPRREPAAVADSGS